jgi:hypothetical protein
MDPYRQSDKKIVVQTIQCPYNFTDKEGKCIHWTVYLERLLNKALSEGLLLLSHSVITNIETENPYYSDDEGGPYYGVMITCVMQKV